MANPALTLFLACLAACALFPCIAHAETLAESAIAPDLTPGAYLWGDDTSIDDPLAIVVSLPLQRLHVYRGSTLIGVSSVSTGKRGKGTPVGDFQILQKNRWHRSNLYSDAPMPFMQRLTWDGIAIHAGHNPGFPASHGCIRVPTAFARRLFEMTTLGVNVLVTDETITPPYYLPLDDLDWVLRDTGVADAPDSVALAHAQPHWKPWRQISALRSNAYWLDYSPTVFLE